MMKKNEFQAIVDQNLSSLVWDEHRRARVWHAIDKEERPVRKLSTTFILVAAILCLSMTALAAGLMFSPEYETGKIADQALQKKYGLNAEVLSLFRREIIEHDDGTATVTYSAPEADFPAAQMGSYTVQVERGKAAASWSNDGKDTSGGLMAEAFGTEQLTMLIYDYANTMQLLYDAGLLAPRSPIATPNPRLQGEIVWTEEDQAEADAALEQAKLADEQRLAGIAKAEAMGTTSVQEAVELAKKAIVQEYALNADQQKKLCYEPDSTVALFDDNQPALNLLFWLWQQEDGSFTEKDGAYWVTINLRTGMIDQIIYDTGLAGNG